MGKVTKLEGDYAVVELNRGVEVKIQRASVISVLPEGTLNNLLIIKQSSSLARLFHLRRKRMRYSCMEIFTDSGCSGSQYIIRTA